MSIARFCVFIGTLCVFENGFLEASSGCGIRRHSFVPLINHGWKVEEGQWPWHVALFHKKSDGSNKYACGGTLIDEKHILTAAHCVRNPDTRYPLQASSILLHFGQQNLSVIAKHTQIREVIKVHVHPEFETHRNDIAVLVTKQPIEHTEYVIPICMDKQATFDDLRNLVGKRGWITGWGTTQNGSISDVLRTASMPVVDYVDCIDEGQNFGNLINRNVFCAGDRNGTSPGTGDSGGGMYVNDGDRWVLKGIVSFAKADEMKAEVDTSKYAVFVNVHQFLTWIREVTDQAKSEAIRGPKRISEKECDRFKNHTRKTARGTCLNSGQSHTVLFFDTDEGRALGSGVLVNENHVLTSCTSTELLVGRRAVKVQIDIYRIDIEKSTCHPQYKWILAGFKNNLAVIKLNSSVVLYDKLIPTCLASNWTAKLFDRLVQTGYGYQYHGNTSISRVFESDENRVIPNSECSSLFHRATHAESEFCVINQARLKISTHESFGSPLQSVNSLTCLYTTVGFLYETVTFNEGSNVSGARESIFSIYAHISILLDWIEEIVWNEEPLMTTTSTRAPPPRAPSSNDAIIFPDD